VPDRQGRILVPPYLREYAGIDAECVIVGIGNSIEVWSKDGWAQQLQTLNDPTVNAARFSALNLSAS
jgi:MraZ protein